MAYSIATLKAKIAAGKPGVRIPLMRWEAEALACAWGQKELDERTTTDNDWGKPCSFALIREGDGPLLRED